MAELPGILAEIAEAAGVGAALALARARGGTRITLPKRVRPDSVLAQIVGFEAAVAIVKALGHGEVAIPCGPQRGAAGRRRAVVQAVDGGASVAAAARAADVCERTAYRVLEKTRRPLPLFDGLDDPAD